MKRAGIRIAISSWWGPNTYEDKVFRKILNYMDIPRNPYRDLKWSILYEMEAHHNPTTEEIVNDLLYIIKLRQ